MWDALQKVIKKYMIEVRPENVVQNCTYNASMMSLVEKDVEINVL